MALRIFPESVRLMLASKSMRLRHELWHFVRAVWGDPEFPEKGRQILRTLKWDLPEGRAPFSADRKLLLDNFAGEDFLFMHRQMIAMTDQSLAELEEPPITRWTGVPLPGDSEFPVPPPWDYKDPAQSDEDNARTSQFLAHVKSDEYFERTMRVREAFFTDPANLRHLSLGALGNLAEMTIHNMVHMRWSNDPGGYRPSVDLEDPTGGDPHWDDPSYDYLGDTYSSHVNPHFWHLHGWIDTLIDTWAEANRVDEINWTGTWVGGPSLVDDQMLMAITATPVEVLSLRTEEKTTAIADLAQVARHFALPKTLMEIAREEGILGHWIGR